ncbi:MAG TPA: protein-disulfide reductase DsbD family protein, partial [Cellvibrio sp.]|nr:protein-disulfide reductase DsbD family protein [Cellvibrio sp.]
MPSSFGFPSFNFSISRYFFAALIFLAIPYANAVDLIPAPNANASPAKATLISNQHEYLRVTEAYKLSSEIKDAENNTKNLSLTWTIAPEYYLYQERFKFRATPEITLNPSHSPEGKHKFDEFAGKDMTLHYHEVTVDFSIPADSPAFDLRVTSQGCAEAGLCYPPYSESLLIDPATNTTSAIAN